MGRESNTGLGVNNHYGPRKIPDNAMGVIKTEGSLNDYSFEFSGEELDTVSFVLPAGILMKDYTLEVEEGIATDVSGISVGTSGSSATNGVTLDQADLAAPTIVDGTTFNGTWASALLTETEVEVTGVVTGFGKARLVIRYFKV